MVQNYSVCRSSTMCNGAAATAIRICLPWSSTTIVRTSTALARGTIFFQSVIAYVPSFLSKVSSAYISQTFHFFLMVALSEQAVTYLRHSLNRKLFGALNGAWFRWLSNGHGHCKEDYQKEIIAHETEEGWAHELESGKRWLTSEFS